MKRLHTRRKIQIKNKFFKLFKTNHSAGRPDYFLIGLVLIIASFGLVMLSSASSVESFRRFDDTYYFFWRQLIRGFIPGLLLFYILSKIDYRKWEKFSLWFYGGSLAFLLLVFVPGLGADYGTASSWISVGGLSIQPSEVAKLFLILSLAGWFSYRGREASSDFWNGLVPFSVILGLISLLVALQPDIGTLFIIVIVAMSMFFVAGAKLIHLGGLALAGVGALGILIVQAPYRAARLTTFLHPDIDPSGIGYHINQAFLAVGSGGLFGLGFGQSRQKFAYLPEVMGDSIFAIIAEELGFIFTTLLLIMFLLLAWRGIKLAKATSDDFAKLVTVGIVSWFSFQALFNVSAMIGLMPITGIPLPFISFGGTALVANFAAAGILVNISKHVY